MAKAATADGSAGKKRKKKKSKKKLIRNIVLGVIAFIALIVWYGLQPLTGPIQVGICRTFVELELRYPSTMQLTTTDQFIDATRLYYTFTGPFGENRSSVVECRFRTDPATGQMSVYAIKIDNNSVPEKRVSAFNKTVPYVMLFNPDRVIPPPYEDDLYDLKRD